MRRDAEREPRITALDGEQRGEERDARERAGEVEGRARLRRRGPDDQRRELEPRLNEEERAAVREAVGEDEHGLCDLCAETCGTEVGLMLVPDQMIADMAQQEMVETYGRVLTLGEQAEVLKDGSSTLARLARRGCRP